MMTEELTLVNEDVVLKIRKVKDATADMWNLELYEPNHWVDIILDRNQAHLSMLYLQEHLKNKYALFR